jgi:hypothetical protein
MLDKYIYEYRTIKFICYLLYLHLSIRFLPFYLFLFSFFLLSSFIPCSKNDKYYKIIRFFWHLLHFSFDLSNFHSSLLFVLCLSLKKRYCENSYFQASSSPCCIHKSKYSTASESSEITKFWDTNS